MCQTPENTENNDKLEVDIHIVLTGNAKKCFTDIKDENGFKDNNQVLQFTFDCCYKLREDIVELIKK
jgi:hypothetical protein